MSKQDTFTFDKFIDDIVVKEEKSRRKNVQKEVSPSRKLANRFTEKANNSIRWVKR